MNQFLSRFEASDVGMACLSDSQAACGSIPHLATGKFSGAKVDAALKKGIPDRGV